MMVAPYCRYAGKMNLTVASPPAKVDDLDLEIGIWVPGDVLPLDRSGLSARLLVLERQPAGHSIVKSF
jgi:hypothetical protein